MFIIIIIFLLAVGKHSLSRCLVRAARALVVALDVHDVLVLRPLGEGVVGRVLLEEGTGSVAWNSPVSLPSSSEPNTVIRPTRGGAGVG